MAEDETKIYEPSLLLDFYGGMLTERQAECVNLRYNEDMSLSEIGRELGISSQGARDLSERAGAKLRGLEQKLGLVGRFHNTRTLAEEALSELSELTTITDGRARELAGSALFKLREVISRY